MKRLILFELIIIFLATTFESDSPPGWYQQTIPRTDVVIQDIYFLDSLTGHIVTRKNTNDSAFIFKTIDGGSTWTLTFKGNIFLNTIQFTDANVGYSGGGDGLAKMYKTTNSGLNWLLQSSLGFVLIEDLFFVNKDTGWVCNSFAFGGLYRTTNGGVNWEQQLNDSYEPTKLFFINNDTGWAGSANFKLYRTTNSGVNWTQIFTFTGSSILSIYFRDGLNGWVGGAGSGNIKYTTDGGFSWTVSNGEIGGYDIKFINDSIGYAGGGSQPLRILKTTNKGRTWWYQNAQATPDISLSVLNNDTLNAWAGKQILIHTTDGGGQMLIGIHQINTEVPSEYKLSQNYPNPFNPVTNIKYSVKRQTSNVKLVVYDIQGRFITELVNQKQNAGTYLADWNASGFASGLYFYSFIVDGVVIDTRKMILIK
jgi:photosystem II stability/assembly factor-like uncharacterized protein